MSQDQVGAEHPALADLSARLEDAAPLVPPDFVRDVRGGGVGDPAVQTGGLTWQSDVLEPAGDEKPAVEGAQPAFAQGFVIVGGDDASRREPGERHASVLGGAEVHAPVRQDEKRETAPRSDPHGAHPACGTVVEYERLDARDLLQPPHPPLQLRACQKPTVEIHTILHLDLLTRRRCRR